MANELPAWGEDRLREALVLLRDDDADPYSFSGDGDDAGRVITQHRYYRWGDDCVIAIGELNWPNQWDDDAFDAKVDALTAALDGTRGDAWEREAFSALHRLQHDGTPAAQPIPGGSIIRWAADEIAALRASPVEGLTSGEGRALVIDGDGL